MLLAVGKFLWGAPKEPVGRDRSIAVGADIAGIIGIAESCDWTARLTSMQRNTKQMEKQQTKRNMVRETVCTISCTVHEKAVRYSWAPEQRIVRFQFISKGFTVYHGSRRLQGKMSTLL